MENQGVGRHPAGFFFPFGRISSIPSRIRRVYTGTNMKKTLFWVILLLAPLLIAAEGSDAKISWSLPNSYANGTPIDPADVQKIVVKVYSGPSRNGPWGWVATSLPGATSATVPAPSAGQTIWYTAKSSLQGADSEYAVPVSKTNLSIPITPMMKKIAKKMLTMKKMILLLFLVLLAGLVGLVRYRGKRGKG
jgi:hypothetical protein